ncbi:hypothetical protein chiPu_0025456 [Chiloscyllium punctatum]|uniref:Uncharacterized protein n=1 Tax=Chiloscyllium punctatum TaxID=137246 RepID=A0A401TEF4_CHIPU|nr:hypothetical protein [Chiloscyllium punctatum]
MLRSGWRPTDPLDAQREWWVHQKRDRYEKACILVLQAHVRLASEVQLYVQDKQKQASEHIEAQALANRMILLTLSEPPSAPPSPTWDWEGLNGSWCADLNDSRRKQEAALADFKADVSEAIGHTPVDWNAIVAVTQKPGEGAQEYGARKFEAFQAQCGIPDADRQNPGIYPAI